MALKESFIFPNCPLAWIQDKIFMKVNVCNFRFSALMRNAAAWGSVSGRWMKLT